MNSLRTLSVLLSPLLLLNACASATGTYQPLGADHPASPGAPESAVPDPSAFLRTEGGQAWAGEVAAPSAAPDAPAGAFVCPMHAHVSSDQPGTCPECGMKLVPRDEAEQAHEEHPDGR